MLTHARDGFAEAPTRTHKAYQPQHSRGWKSCNWSQLIGLVTVTIMVTVNPRPWLLEDDLVAA